MKLYTLVDGNINISEELENVEFTHCCDILCVGAGSAGIFAADSAALEGCDVILIENSSCIGGTSIRGNVCSYYYGDEGGAYVDIDRQCDRKVFLADMQQPETKQVLIYKKLRKDGVRIYCNHTPIGVYFEDNRVIGLLISCNEGLISIRAKPLLTAQVTATL